MSIQVFWTGQLYQPPYNPDLVPSNFHLFQYLNKILGGQWCTNDKEVKTLIMDLCSSQATDFFEVRIQKLVEQYNICSNKNIKTISMICTVYFSLLKNGPYLKNIPYIYHSTSEFSYYD